MKYLFLISSLWVSTMFNISNSDLINPIPQTAIDSKHTVLSLDQAPQGIFDSAYTQAKLSAEEIKQIDDLVGKELKNYNKKVKNFMRLKGYSRYYKQMIPAFNLIGEKEIWLNCLCSVTDEPDWKTRLIMVLDGGSCYFQIKVNLSKKIVYDLGVNGVA